LAAAAAAVMVVVLDSELKKVVEVANEQPPSKTSKHARF
jgi:hypothetical protein